MLTLSRLQQPTAVIRVEALAGEGVHEHGIGVVSKADKEVTGEVHAPSVEPITPAHLDIDHGKRDRQSSTRIQDPVDATVVDLVVALRVPTETTGALQKGAQGRGAHR